jgi:hypothetical protein
LLPDGEAESRQWCYACDLLDVISLDSSVVLQELARLWDWQHRRAALGLSPDLPHSSSSSSSMASAAAGAQADAAAKAAVAAAKAEAAQAAVAAAEVQESDLSGSSSSSDDEVAVAIAAEDMADKGAAYINTFPVHSGALVAVGFGVHSAHQTWLSAHSQM